MSKLALNSSVVLMVLLVSTFAHAQSAARCADLTTLRIQPAEIGLPSGGAAIISAQIATAPADPKTPGASREFCKVLGAIAPVDPNAPPVNFEVNLPLNWNGKAVQYGGGGFNGALVTGLGRLTPNSSRLDTPVPLALGYATWGTDSGHEAAKLPEIQAFALNDEALINFSYAAYKKTRDSARQIAIAFYDRAPAKIYYVGGSEGGREGLTMAQRFPADFDGIISVVPVIGWSGLQSAGNRSGSVQQNGGWLNPAKVGLLHGAVLAACDSMDGLADGVISAYEKCLGVFDPKTLRCANGADAGDTCLSDKQIAVLETLHRPFDFRFPLANGATAYPGFNYGGENQPGGMIDWVTGMHPATYPIDSPDAVGRQWYYGSGYVRYFIARDPKFDPFRFDPHNFASRVRQVSELMDSTNPDLSDFLARGGKLILKEHGADYGQSPFQGINYYKSVVTKMGQSRVDQFIRFYVTPGVSHDGTGIDGSGRAVPHRADLLTALDEWVQSGKAPNTLLQVSQETNAPFSVISSRPLCRYPLYPRYNGQREPTQASSFTCTRQ